jgi:tetratricopeptide (TPR) repeat protein
LSDDQHPPDDQDPTRLDSHELDGDRLQSVPSDSTAPAGGEAPDEGSTRKRLGDFELLRELGRGGMGIVYEARQLSLDRRVALKVLPPALGLTGQATQRFEREARAAAKLHHTNIVPVYAIGEEEGSHYYVMELIEGDPLSAVLNDLRGPGSNPLMEAAATQTTTASKKPVESTSSTESGPISLSDTSSSSREWFDTVARLLAEVADALHYAHGKGVIHRDVKPANLMLSADGRLCLTDFGLARMAQEPGMTVSGSFLGTPAYMSPEQIAAGRVEIDARTDVYSLGAVLYEMLTLQRPFTGDSRDKILQAIMTKDPRPPRRFNSRIPVDLETICQKAMEKDRDRRYASATELAEDLRHYLQRGLITARRAGLARRTWKSIRRHPVAATAAVGVIVIVLLGTFAQRLWVGRSEERAGRLVAAAEVDLRQGTYRHGLEKTERALAIDPEMPEAKRIRGRLLLEENINPRELIRVAREILAGAPDDWEAHGWLAYLGAYEELGDIPVQEHVAALEKNAPDTAEAWYLRGISARSIRERIRCFDRALDLDPGHALALLRRAQARGDLRDTAAAIADYQAAIAVRPRATRGRRFLAGFYLWVLHDFDRALEEFDKAVAIDPDDYLVYRERSWVYRPGNLDDREKSLEGMNRATELAPATSSRTPADRARALQWMGRYEEALPDARRAVEVEPHIPENWDPLGLSLWKLQRLDEVRETMDELRGLADGWPNPWSASRAYRSLSVVHRWLGEHDEAVATAERAIELDPMEVDGYSRLAWASYAQAGVAAVEVACDRVQVLELDEPEPLKKRAVLLRDVCRRREAALAEFARAIEIAPQWADLYYERGQLHANRADHAIEDLEMAIELAPRWPDPHRVKGHRLTVQKRYEEALEAITRAIELAPRHANAIFNRANVYMNLERFEEALADLDRCLELVGGPTASAGNARFTQAAAMARLGREEEALAAADLAVANNPEWDVAIRGRGLLSLQLGRTTEALEYAERAVREFPNSAGNYIYRARAILNGEVDCDRVLADLATARDLAPEDPAVAGEIGWMLPALVFLRCPDRFDGDLALALATAAVKDQPENAVRQIGAGLTSYRLGRFHEAREHLIRGADLRVPKPEPWELFALAMTEWKLGNESAARDTYDRALARMEATWPRYPEYLMLREEAADLLGIEP